MINLHFNNFQMRKYAYKVQNKILKRKVKFFPMNIKIITYIKK